MKKTKRSLGQEIIASLNEFKTALGRGERISQRFTVRKVVLDLEPMAYRPDDVRKIRNSLGASQAIFAKFLGVSVQTVRAWEQGEKSPRDVACRFMDEIRRDPAYWRKRLASVARVKLASAG
jgi:putative transcriptional regulator